MTFVTGLETESLSASLDTFVAGRVLDDNVQVMLRFRPKGQGPAATGMLWASQVATGNENQLQLRIYGSRGGIEWAQMNPDNLWFTPLGKPKRLVTRGGAGANEAANAVTRIPAGHPEGYLEGFATLYTETAQIIRIMRGGSPEPENHLLPTVRDGLDGMRFIEACIRSSNADGGWTGL